MRQNRSSRQIIDYAVRSTAATTETTGAEVYSRFQEEPNTLVIAVVDGEGHPVGMIERNSFFLKMGAEYGRALFGRRPVTFVMDEPVVAQEDDSVMEYMGGALLRNPASLLRGFIVVDNYGYYLATGSALSLLEAGYVAANARIEDLGRLTQELARKEKEAQAAARAKSQFLATMSHEIRTPLNGVLAVAEIIDARLKQEDLRPYVRTILKSGVSLHRLLSDVLDLSRGEAGAVSLTPEAVNLAELAEETEALWQPMAATQKLALKVETNAPADLFVFADGVRLRQVINNLTGNALKFTEAGQVRVRIEANLTDDGDAAVEVHVEDTGPGIEASQLRRIFEPFAKVSEHNGGAGLGLSICRQIVAAMGGDISAQSTPGEGSHFKVRLEAPLSSGAEPAATVTAAMDEQSSGARVLIVDDNETNRMVASTFVEMAGMSWTLACNGLEAVEAAGLEAYDLILMDVKMPLMDGIEATRTIRASAGPNQLTPILALTANTDPQDIAAYRLAGMSGFVGKPLQSAQLFDAIERLAEGEMAFDAAA